MSLSAQFIPLSRVPLAEILGVDLNEHSYDDDPYNTNNNSTDLTSTSTSSFRVHHHHHHRGQSNSSTTTTTTTTTTNAMILSGSVATRGGGGAIIGIDMRKKQHQVASSTELLGSKSHINSKNNKKHASKGKPLSSQMKKYYSKTLNGSSPRQQPYQNYQGGADKSKKLDLNETWFQSSVRLCSRVLCNIRSKTVLTLIISLLIMMLLFGVTLIGVYAGIFNKLSSLIAQDSVLRVMSNMYNDVRRTLDKQQSYSNWIVADIFEPGQFSQEKLNDFIDSYYFAEYMQQSHQINYAGFYFLNGTLARGVAYDLETLEALEWPMELNELPIGHPLNQEMENTQNSKGGFMHTRNGDTLLATTMPMFYSTPNTVGILLYAKIFNARQVQILAQRSQLCLTLYSQNETRESQMVKSVLKRAETIDPIILSMNSSACVGCRPFYRTVWNTKSNKSKSKDRQCWNEDVASDSMRSASFFILKDIFGEKSVLLRLDEPQPLMLLAIKAFLFNYGVMAIIVLLLAIIVVLFVEITVLQPISKLSLQLKNIVKDNDITERIHLVDFGEIGTLTQFINGLLMSLENTFEMITDENESLQTINLRADVEGNQMEVIMSSLNEIVIFCNASGVIMVANHTFFHRFGYTPNTTYGTLPISSVIECDDLKTLEEDTSIETHIKDAVTNHQTPLLLQIKKRRMIISDQRMDVYLLIGHDMSENSELRTELDKQRNMLNNLK